MIIAIDGPAGSGKSTVAKLLAKELQLELLDTGAMYRAFAIAAMREGIGEDDPQLVENLIPQLTIGFTDTNPKHVTLNGEDIADQIRSLEVSQLASQLSAISCVRRALVASQQSIIQSGRWVLEGRDVTTVVAPQANLKIFLTASIEERARRRWLELKNSPNPPTLQAVVKEVVERDHRDYTRSDSPLMLAEDALIIETFNLLPEEIVRKISLLAQ